LIVLGNARQAVLREEAGVYRASLARAEKDITQYFAPNDDTRAIIEQEIEHNQFVIATDQPSVKVSWQVTGIRRDPLAQTRRMEPVREKPDNERGLYKHPKAYGLDEDKFVSLGASLEDLHFHIAEPKRRFTILKKLGPLSDKIDSCLIIPFFESFSNSVLIRSTSLRHLSRSLCLSLSITKQKYLSVPTFDIFLKYDLY